MLRLGRRFIASLLALALLLAPLEFVYAHDGGSAVMDETSMQHAHHADSGQEPQLKAEAGHDCGAPGDCAHCVYCSPALNHALSAEVHVSPPARLTMAVPADYSIDLPIDDRPPRTL